MTDCKDKCWCKRFPIRESDADDPPLLQGMTHMAHKIEHLYDGVEKCFERIERLEHFNIATQSYCDTLHIRIARLEEHHTRQIDENRKISRRVDELEKNYHSMAEKLFTRVELIEDRLNRGT